MRNIIYISLLASLLFSCSNANKAQKTNQKTQDSEEKESGLRDERDAKTYKTVKIGSQRWMAENLAYRPKNGNYLAYDNDSANIAKHGYLYDWETAEIACPSGWHLPSDEEWSKLIDYLGGSLVAGIKMKSTTGWANNGNGDNKSGFNGFPSGYHYSNPWFENNEESSFKYNGSNGFWWTSTEAAPVEYCDYDPDIKENSLCKKLDYKNDKIKNVSKLKHIFISVRCIKD